MPPFWQSAALLASAIFALLSAIHVYWAGGGRWGATASYPELPGRTWRPGKAATLAVAGALLAAALLMLARIGCAPGLPAWIPRAGVWTLCAVFGLRAIGNFKHVGLFKTRRAGRFAWWDTVLFSPLCLVIATLAGWVAVAAP